MGTHFKCCVSKEFTNLCCVVCYGIFHPSCLERRRAFTRLDDHKIYCSKECKSEDDLKRSDLLEEINALGVKLEERKKYIKQLEKKVEDGLNGYEPKYIKRLEDGNDLVDRVSREKAELLLRNDELNRIVEENHKHILQLESDLRDLDTLNGNMVTSIQALEAENAVWVSDLRGLREEVSRLETERVLLLQSQQNKEVENSEKAQAVKLCGEKADAASKRPRLLILCDQYGYKLNRILSSSLGGFTVQLIVKPNAGFENVIQDVAGLSACFTRSDYIVIIAGANDFARNKYPSFRMINSRLKCCTHTNIILASVPYFMYNERVNKFVYRFNCKLLEYTLRLNRYAEASVSFLDVNDSGGHLGRAEVSRKIEHLIKLEPAVGNLKFVPIVDFDDVECLGNNRDGACGGDCRGTFLELDRVQGSAEGLTIS